MCFMGLKLVWVMSTTGTKDTLSFIKIQEVTLQSLVDLAGMTHIARSFTLLLGVFTNQIQIELLQF